MSQRGSSGKKSAKSAKSRASIDVTVPVPVSNLATDDQHGVKSPVSVRQLSPGERLQPRGSPSPPRNASRQGSVHSNRSQGTVPPRATPTVAYSHESHLTEVEKKKHIAAVKIERCWMSFRDQQMFRLLKHAVCAAEHSLSHEILRKVSPKECEILRDKCFQAKIRFRFGGAEFPPMIFFKVYVCTPDGKGVKYLSGKRVIQPATDAARDACNRMGHRLFYNQLIQDTLHRETHKITDEVDVTTLKDYMQYTSLLDETPAYMGGRDNTWRRLTLEALPRQTIFYDVVEFLYSQNVSERLQAELPALLSRPTTEDIQRQHIHIISQLHQLTPEAPHPTPKSKVSGPTPQSSRRSRKAKTRADKMRQMYSKNVSREEDGEATLREVENANLQKSYSRAEEFDDELGQLDGEEGEWEEEWEREASKLYQWTQELSLEELVQTPRLQTGLTYS